MASGFGTRTWATRPACRRAHHGSDRFGDHVAGVAAREPDRAGHRVVRFDNRDIGLSTHIDYASAPYSIDDMADDTVALLDALDIEAAHFVGASMGGMISQVLALRYPARVRSLTLLITSPGPDERLSPSSDEVLAIAVQPADTDEALSRTRRRSLPCADRQPLPVRRGALSRPRGARQRPRHQPEQRARDGGVLGAIARR